MLEHLIGSAASVIAFALFLPQARATWRNRHNATALRAVSLGTQWLVVTNALLWFAYGAVTQAFWIAAPGFVNLPLAMMSIALISRARRKNSRRRTAGGPAQAPGHQRGQRAQPAPR